MKKIIFSLLLFVSGISGASQFPDKSDAFAITDFSAGLYTNAIGNKIPPNAAKVLKNFLIDERTGSLYKSNGYTILGSTAGLSKITFILPYIHLDNTVEFLVTDNSSLLSTVDFLTYKPVKLGLSNSSDLYGIQYKTKTWWTNGADPVFTYTYTSPEVSTVTVMDGNTYGTLVTPNIPRGKCIEADLKRIWVGNIPTDNSAIYWSTLYSTDGVRVDPDDYRAWQSVNTTPVGLGDGQALTFLKSFGGTLIAGKERSIYSRYGDSDTSFIFIKTRAKIGFLSQLSVIEHENTLFGQSYDGFYAFDGDNVASISDYIRPDFLNIRSDVTRTVSNKWDTQVDFAKGSFYGTTATASGLLQVIQDTATTYSAVVPTSPLQNIMTYATYTFTNGGSTSTIPMPILSTYTLVPTQLYKMRTPDGNSVKIYWKQRNSDTKNPAFNIRNTRTNEGYETYPALPVGVGTSWGSVDMDMTNSIIFLGDDINNGRIVAKAMIASVEASKEWYVQIPSISAHITYFPYQGGSYTSDIATFTSNSGWGTFDSVYNSNGGNINFFIRSSTSMANTSTGTLIPISPGSIIGSSVSNVYAQWFATFTSLNGYVDSVQINHNEGNASITRSFGVDYNGRLMIGVSTESTGNYSVIYVKSRRVNQLSQLGSLVSNSPAWTTLQGINIRFITKYQNYLYAGMASTGSVIRMDYGTNYGGDPIVSIYESGDLILGADFTYKDAWEYMIDANSTNGATLKVGTSVNNRSLNYNNVLLDDTNGNSFKYVHNPNGGNATYAKLLRIRLENSELDKDLKINNFGIVFRPTKIR